MDQVAQVREKINLVSLIAEYLPLKKMGRNFKALCPFHSEKTPSFVVSPERQIWHCFGCQKGGDCFTFLMEYERLEFPEALRILAKRAGVELSAVHFEPGITSKKEQIYNLNSLAAEFYHYILTKHKAGKKALLYLQKRGLKPQTMMTFKLGFSPNVNYALVSYLLNKKKYKKEEITEAGLSTYKNGRMADFFVGRIIFPLFDHRDNIIGFSGRVLVKDSTANWQSESKYVNTRETIVYHKGDVFFGLNIAKETIKKENTAIIMEGEFDVISSFQEGIVNAIAVKGTALTENQVNLIARYAQKIALCFDQDKAGLEAIKRSLPILEKKGLTTMIILPNGKDPDESITKSPLEFKKAIKNEIGVYDYLFGLTLKNFDKNKIEGKKSIADELLPFFSQIENEIVKEHYLKKLSAELATSYDSILKQVEKLTKKEPSTQMPSTTTKKRDRQEILEEYLLALILQAEKTKEIFQKASKILSNISFKTSSIAKILQRLSVYFKNQETLNVKKFLDALPVELSSSFDLCYIFPLPKFFEEEKYEEEVIKVAEELRVLSLREKIKGLTEKIKKEENSNELKLLRNELLRLISLLKRS